MRYSAQMQAVVDLLSDILSSDLPADVLATQYFRTRRYIGSGDRRVISGLTFGILRHREKINWWVEHIGLKGAHRSRSAVMVAMVVLDFKTIDEVAEVFAGEQYGPSPLNAIEQQALTHLEGAQLDHPEMPAHVRMGLPVWSYEKLQEIFGASLAEEVAAMNEQAPLDLRVNTLITTREEVMRKLEKNGWDVEPTKLSPLGVRVERGRPLSKHELFTKGFVEVQDEGSQLVALLCDARPGQAVLDFCAGAGGKTLALAGFMQNKGRLMATDVVEYRLSKAKQRLRRAGVSNHELKLLDEQGLQWLRRQHGRFDRVLVDAPCSGSGTWRRNPDLKFRFNQTDLDELVSKQREILDKAAPLVKVGGNLIYATCSLYQDENEEQVMSFLSRHPNYQLTPAKEIWPECPADTPWLRLSPHQHDTDGFFVAVIRRGE